MITDFPTRNIKVAMFHTGKHGWRYSCMEFGVFHISYKEIWAHIFLLGIWSFPYFIQKNLGTYKNMGDTFLE